MKIFIAPIAISIIALTATLLWSGPAAFFLTLLLSILEITLSFDNAVVNAKVLNQMDELWQKRFLTWGILVAVFGTRLVLPALIVSFAGGIWPWDAFSMAFYNPRAYGEVLEGASHAIKAFGGIFLLMVSLKYFFDTAKDVHWIEVIEKRLSLWGRIEAIEIALALTVLLALAYVSGEQAIVLFAGCVGLLTFVAMQGITSTIETGTHASTAGFSLFLYLNVLDSAFSLDGVVGAFALTSDILIILVGLGLGAYFVRSITVYLVRQQTLDALIYLEHGAHWAIFGLGLSMLAGLLMHVPEAITGLVGLVCVSAAYYSSRKVLAVPV